MIAAIVVLAFVAWSQSVAIASHADCVNTKTACVEKQNSTPTSH